MAVGVGSFLPTFLTRCIVIYSCVNFLSMVVTLKECTTIDHCSCSTDKGKISLWKLAETGKPRFSEIPTDSKDNTISWNPCSSYSEGKCVDVAACLEFHGESGIAKQNTATCVLRDGECALNYTGERTLRLQVTDHCFSNTETRYNSTQQCVYFNSIVTMQTNVSVKLRCDESQDGKVDPVNIQKLRIFTTILHSKYACPIAPPLPSGSHGLSLGSVLVIIFFCLVIVYITSGILVNKYIRSVEGNKVFPNYSFWMDLPYFIKDGCVFTFHSLQSLCGKGTRRSGYESI
ncbi:uncharacterized protein [Montipora capricornis]|uniref:uncharacterized protein isoform X1 n=1 Tax=Montipora capricornis TaxID=246305 RepID=UPI0035F1E8FC